MANVQLSSVAPAGGGGAGIAAIGSVPPVMPMGPPVTGPAAANADSAANPVAGIDPANAPAQPGAPFAQPGAGTLPPAGDQALKKAVKDANAALAANGTQLVFVFDDQTHHFSVKLLDIQTQKVVQEVPPAAVHAAANTLTGPPASGTLVDTKA